MSKKDSTTPEFLQIKGYKYRAKMLIAASVILIILLLLIIFAVRGISSALHRNKETIDTDSQSTDSYSTDISADSDIYESIPSDSSSDSDNTVGSGSQETFDADGRLVIDTDTLDGKKAVAITFDDGPGEFTVKLIEGLNARGAKATFFMVGSCVEQYPEALPLMVSGGHQLGNHTYNHTDITSISNKEMNDQISKTDNAIYSACGQTSTAFRPPYGAYTNDIAITINKTITLWSVDTVDWNLKNAESVKQTIVSQCKDGDIILLHDIYEPSVDGALAAIDELSEQGFVFVTVDELLTRYGYEIEKGKAHSSQYAVYETDSPYAQKYLKEINAKKAEQASSNAADSFYYESSRKPQENTSSDSDEASSDSIPIVSADTDTGKKRLIY